MKAKQTNSAFSSIIIVDDNPDNLHFLLKLLDQKGYNIKPLSNGEIVLASAKDSGADLQQDEVFARIEACSENFQKKDSGKNKKNSIDNFPEALPGFNIKAGLKNVAENKKMFRKLILQFKEKFADAADQMRDILKKGELEKGERLIHNLKGVSGNLGAVDLFSITELFEHALKCCASDNFKGMLEKLEKEIKKVLESADVLKELVPEEKRGAALDENTDPEILESCLRELYILLNDNDLVEEELMDSLYNYSGFSDYKESLKELESYIELFDYENAIKTLKIIAGALNVSLDMGGKNEE